MPNIGASELADSLNRVLPFTAKDDTRPILQCVNFIAKEGKLTIVSADGFRLAIETLSFDEQDGQALVRADDLKGVVSALKRAKRARVSFEPSGKSLDGMSLIIDTELIRYNWVSVEGSFPDWLKLIPTEFNTVAHFDTLEGIKAVNSLKALLTGKECPIDLTIGEGKIVMASPDDKGQAELPADIDGQVQVRVDGQYLAQALRACGGMVDLKLTNGYSPMLFSSNGYQLVVMPMLSDNAKEQEKADRQAKGEQTEPAEQGEQGDTEPVAEQGETEPAEQAEPEPKKRSRKQAVTA